MWRRRFGDCSQPLFLSTVLCVKTCLFFSLHCANVSPFCGGQRGIFMLSLMNLCIFFLCNFTCWHGWLLPTVYTECCLAMQDAASVLWAFVRCYSVRGKLCTGSQLWRWKGGCCSSDVTRCCVVCLHPHTEHMQHRLLMAGILGVSRQHQEPLSNHCYSFKATVPATVSWFCVQEPLCRDSYDHFLWNLSLLCAPSTKMVSPFCNIFLSVHFTKLGSPFCEISLFHVHTSQGWPRSYFDKHLLWNLSLLLQLSLRQGWPPPKTIFVDL